MLIIVNLPVINENAGLHNVKDKRLLTSLQKPCYINIRFCIYFIVRVYMKKKRAEGAERQYVICQKMVNVIQNSMK